MSNLSVFFLLLLLFILFHSFRKTLVGYKFFKRYKFRRSRQKQTRLDFYVRSTACPLFRLNICTSTVFYVTTLRLLYGSQIDRTCHVTDLECRRDRHTLTLNQIQASVVFISWMYRGSQLLHVRGDKPGIAL